MFVKSGFKGSENDIKCAKDSEIIEAVISGGCAHMLCSHVLLTYCFFLPVCVHII